MRVQRHTSTASHTAISNPRMSWCEPTEPDWAPRWSPDNLEIAFYSYRSGNRDIWVMPASGGAARQLTTNEATDWLPAWSPDGRELAFHTRADGDAVWIVPSAGGEPHRFTDGGAAPVAWSPDGRWMVVNRGADLYRVERDGSGDVRLGRGNSPRVSRDGRWIFYNIIGGPRAGLYAHSVVDRTVRRLTSLSDRAGRLGGGFAADDRYLYFAWLEDVGDLWVMDVARGGQP